MVSCDTKFRASDIIDPARACRAWKEPPCTPCTHDFHKMFMIFYPLSPVIMVLNALNHP